jgi:hypothetical protein
VAADRAACREATALGLKHLTGRVFSSAEALLQNLEVAENELIPLQLLAVPFNEMAEKFYELLEQFRVLTCGQLIYLAVLARPEVFLTGSWERGRNGMGSRSALRQASGRAGDLR